MKFPVIVFAFLIGCSSSLYAEIEPNNDCLTSNSIVIGSSISGNFGQANDKDFFSFSVAKPGLLIIEISDPDTTFDFYGSIHDANCQSDFLFTIVRTSGSARRFEYLICNSGQFYLELRSKDGTISLTNYTLAISFNYDDLFECNNTLLTASDLKLDTLITAYVRGHEFRTFIPDSRDLDYYKIFVPSKGMLKVNLPVVPANQDILVTLFDSTGAFITHDCVCDTTKTIEYIQIVICDPGTYVLLVRDGNFPGISSSEPYQLIAMFIPDSTDCNEVLDDAYPIVNDQIISGSSGGSNHSSKEKDIDWFSFNISEPGVFDIKLIRNDSFYQFDIFIFNPDKKQLLSTDYYGNSGLTYLHDYSLCDIGTYYLKLVDKSADPCGKKNKFTNYEMQLRNVFPDKHECNNTYSTATQVSGKGAIHAALATYHDTDFYRIHLERFDTLTISIDSTPSKLLCQEAIINSNKITLQSIHFFDSLRSVFINKSSAGEHFIRIIAVSGEKSFNLPYRMILDRKSIITNVYDEHSGFFGLISNINADQLQIYKDQKSDWTNVQYLLVNANGNILQPMQKLSEDHSIDINHLSNGIYTLILFKEDRKFILKFIKI